MLPTCRRYRGLWYFRAKARNPVSSCWASPSKWAYTPGWDRVSMVASAAATPMGFPLKVPEAGTPQAMTSRRPTTAPKG